MEAFSDGVLAIIITIMVLELRVPHPTEQRPHPVELADLKPLLPVFLTYVLSFIYLGIYWNNHHHLLKAVPKVNGAMMWANLHLLFWLSLFPFVTGWMGENHFTPVPTALYGAVLFRPPSRITFCRASSSPRRAAIPGWPRPLAAISKASCRPSSTPSPSWRRFSGPGFPVAFTPSWR